MLFITSSNWVFNFTEIWVCKVTDYTCGWAPPVHEVTGDHGFFEA